MDCGTAEIASSEKDEMNGMIMMPMTPPAASALTLYLARTERPEPASDEKVEPWMREIP